MAAARGMDTTIIEGTVRRRAAPTTGGLALAALLLAVPHMAAAAGTEPPASSTTTQQAQAAAAGTRAFDIPAQPLHGALTAFGEQSGLQVTLDAAIADGRTAPAVTGSMTPEDALRLLLTGTGITWHFTSATTVALSRPDAGAGLTILDPVTVEGASPAPRQAEIGNLPSIYAGGQVARGGKLGILGNKDMMDTPFNQTSYTSQLLQDQQSHYVADALMNDATVNVASGASTGFDFFTIRGFSVNGADILYNGMPGIGPTSFNSMLGESVERVEVLKGPNALLNGVAKVNSVGGTINVVPKRAGDEPLTQVTPDYSMNSQFGGHADIARRFGPHDELGVRFNGVYRNGDTPIDRQSREARLGTVALDYRGEQVRATADFGYQFKDLQSSRRPVLVTAGLSAPDAPENSSNFFNPWEFTTSEDFYGTARTEYDPLDGLTLFAAVGASQQRQTNIRSNPTITSASGNLAAGNAFVQGEKVFNTGLEAGARTIFDTGPIGHEVTVAYSRSDLESRSQNVFFAYPASNIFNPVVGTAPADSLVPDPDQAPKQIVQKFSGTTIVDTVSVLDGRVQLTGGVRFQSLRFKLFNTTTGVLTTDLSEDAASPLAGILVKPLSNVSLYANYIQGLQRGSIAPTGTANAGQPFGPFVTKQYEAGVKWDMETVTATLSAYQVALPSGVVDPATNTFGVDGEQRHRGADLNVFGEPWDGIRVLGGVAYVDSVLTKTAGGNNDGNEGVGAPAFRAVLGGEWDLSFVPGLTLTARAVHTSGMQLNAANTSQVPEWTRLDVGARYAIDRPGREPIVVRASVENALDSDYWNANTFGQITLSDPLTFKLSTTFDF